MCATPANFTTPPPPQGRRLTPLPRLSGHVGGRRAKAGRIRPAGRNRLLGRDTDTHPDPPHPLAAGRAPLAPRPGRPKGAQVRPGPPARRRAAEGWVWRPRLPSGKERPPLGLSDLGEGWLLPPSTAEATGALGAKSRRPGEPPRDGRHRPGPSTYPRSRSPRPAGRYCSPRPRTRPREAEGES